MNSGWYFVGVLFGFPAGVVVTTVIHFVKKGKWIDRGFFIASDAIYSVKRVQKP